MANPEAVIGIDIGTRSVKMAQWDGSRIEASTKVAGGKDPAGVARGLHHSHVQITVDALRRVGGKSPVLFTGGVAHNPCIGRLLQQEWKDAIVIPENPDSVGAIGAALLAH